MSLFTKMSALLGEVNVRQEGFTVYIYFIRKFNVIGYWPT